MCTGLLPPGANPIAVKILIIKNNNKITIGELPGSTKCGEFLD